MARPRLRKSWLVCLVVLTAMAVCLFVVCLLLLGRNEVRPSPKDPLVGTWRLAGPGAGSVVLTIRPDGTMSRADYPGRAGGNPVINTARWWVEGGMFVFQEDARGVLGKLEQLAGGGQPIERIPILSISEHEFILGDPKGPIVYRRYKGHLRDVAKPR